MGKHIIAFLFFNYLSVSALIAQQNKVDYKKFSQYVNTAESYFPDSVALSILYAKEAYKVIEKEGNRDSSIKVLNILSKAYLAAGQYNDAISYSLELLKLGEITDNKVLTAKSYLRIGDCYRSLLHFKDALHFHNLAIEKFKIIDDERLLSSAYNHVGATYFENGLYEEALDYFQKAYNILQINADTLELAIIYNSFGIVYSQMGNYIEAKSNFLKALRIFKNYKVEYNIASVNNNLGKLYVELSKLNTAEEYLFNCYNYLKKKPSAELQMNNLQSLINLYDSKKDYKNAYNYLQQFLILHDSIRKKEIVQKVEQFRVVFDVEKMEKDLLIANKQNQIKAKNIRIIMILSLGGGIIAILFLTLLYIRNRQSKTRLLVSEKEKEISLLKLSKIEEEKKRVNENFKAELAFKNRELTSTTMHIVQKNSLINDIRDHLNKMKLSSKINERIVLDIITEIDQNVLLDKDWDVFVKHFKDVHPGFFDLLIKEHPDLTSKEIRYCAYSRLNLSLKEIATILNITTRGVEKARSRIRTKLDLSKDVDLNIYLQKFGKNQ